LRNNRIYDSRDTGVFGSDTMLHNNRFYKNKYQDVHVRDGGDSVVEVNDLSSNVKRPWKVLGNSNINLNVLALESRGHPTEQLWSLRQRSTSRPGELKS
jgi:hypothetical protein